MWNDPITANRERKRLLAYIIEDATLIKNTSDRTITIHVRFRGGRTETILAQNPRSSAEMVRTASETVALVDQLPEDHTYPEIADILDRNGLRPGGTARKGHTTDRFNAKRVAYVVHAYHLTSRVDRLRRTGFLTRKEAAKKLGVHEATLTAWARHGIVTAYKYNDHQYLFEIPSEGLPEKHCSRWDRLDDRADHIRQSKSSSRTGEDAV